MEVVFWHPLFFTTKKAGSSRRQHNKNERKNTLVVISVLKSFSDKVGRAKGRQQDEATAHGSGLVGSEVMCAGKVQQGAFTSPIAAIAIPAEQTRSEPGLDAEFVFIVLGVCTDSHGEDEYCCHC